MQQPTPERLGGERNVGAKVKWIVAVGLALIFLWLIYSATQTATGNLSSSSIPGTNGVVATATPESMPGMNH